MTLAELPTPAALLDEARLDHNIARMQARARALGVRLRPHVKTTKCGPVVQRQLAAGAAGITVSTLKEAEAFFALGVADILYAVGIVPGKLATVQALREQGCRLTVILDSVEAARALVAHGQARGHVFDVMIEIDTDGARAGLPPQSPALPEVARTLVDGGARLLGVPTNWPPWPSRNARAASKLPPCCVPQASSAPRSASAARPPRWPRAILKA
jgi:D-serine deaminase-like pyridoxal phosphate-dependent protein